VQDSIELILKQKLGLDANSVGSRIIARAIAQRQTACRVADYAAYLALVQSSPQELDQLIEAVVIPETWFFRDKGAFAALQDYAQTQRVCHPQQVMKVLSLPCSTGEEPYSIAITLLEAGLTSDQFQVDAIDVSQHALAKAKRAIYSQKSFRGNSFAECDRYFQQTNDSYEVRPDVRKSVNFMQGNILQPHLLMGKQYHVIFCRNLIIYLDSSARLRSIDALDQVLLPLGLLFLGAVETPQLAHRAYQLVHYPAAFAFQKQPPNNSVLTSVLTPDSKLVKQKQPHQNSNSSNLIRQQPTPAPLPPQHSVPISLETLETAQDLADRGQLLSAAQLCESYIRTYPGQAPAYLLLGQIYQGLNQPKQAEQSFQKAIYLNPDTYEALIYLALLKEQQGNYIESQRFRKRAERLIHSGYPSSSSGSKQ
jgi:chemotaxis protein methyltransferase WspC